MSKQVFLGGACGRTTWRKDIAIPILEEAQVTYHDPQMNVGEWTLDDEASEMLTKDEADVLLFVISGKTRSIAAVAEACYLIAAQTPVALCMEFMKPGVEIEGKVIEPYECDDINRGRAFLKSMAERHSMPLFDKIEDATRHAVTLVRELEGKLTLERLQKIIEKAEFKKLKFNCSESQNGFLIWVSGDENCAYSSGKFYQEGRKWFIPSDAKRSFVIQTAFKAVATWQEHEAREHFKYKGARIYGPHFKVDELVNLCEQRALKAEKK